MSDVTIRFLARELKEFEEEIIPHLNTSFGQAIEDLLNKCYPDHTGAHRLVPDPRLDAEPDTARFKSAHLHAAWENPSLIVACPTCSSPVGHYCNDSHGQPKDGPCAERKVAARLVAEPGDAT